MAQADRIIDAAIARGVELDCRPISVIVVEPGCKVKAFKKEDGASMIRFEMAFGKAYAALALGRSSSLVHLRAEERPRRIPQRLTGACCHRSRAAACRLRRRPRFSSPRPAGGAAVRHTRGTVDGAYRGR